MLITFNDVVAISSDYLEPFKLLPHHIELVDGAKPIKQRAYSLSHIKLTALKELKKLIDKGLISPSHSPMVISYCIGTKEKRMLETMYIL